MAKKIFCFNAFHSEMPHATSRAFSGARTSCGRSSYELCLDALNHPAGPVDVLDIGCGDGFLVHCLEQVVTGPFSYCGVDLCEVAFPVVTSPAVRFQKGSAEALDLEDGSVDLIVCHLVFAFLTEPELALAEMRRVLRPGGKLCLVLGRPPEPASSYDAFQQAIREAFRRDQVGRALETNDLSRAPDVLVQAIRKAGFQEVNVDGFQLNVTQKWDFLTSTYDWFFLTARARKELRALCTKLMEEPLVYRISRIVAC